MKKFALALMALLCMALACTPVALASDCEQRICQLATANPKVTDAKCIVYERTAVVAIRTEKFSTRTQYEEFVKEFSTQVKAECEVDRVLVTRNPKVMKQLEQLSNLSDEQREEVIQQLLQELLRVRPLPHEVPKITRAN